MLYYYSAETELLHLKAKELDTHCSTVDLDSSTVDEEAYLKMLAADRAENLQQVAEFSFTIFCRGNYFFQIFLNSFFEVMANVQPDRRWIPQDRI